MRKPLAKALAHDPDPDPDTPIDAKFVAALMILMIILGLVARFM